MTLGFFIDWGGIAAFASDVTLSGSKAVLTFDAGENEYTERLKHAMAQNGHTWAGFARKMVDLSPRTSLCWAGPVVRASALIREFRELWLTREPSVEEIETFVSNYPAADSEGLEAIVVTATDVGWRPAFLNTVPFELNGRHVALIGSGAQDAYAFLESMADLLEAPFSESHFAWIIATLHHSVALLGTGPARAWGGGFEARHVLCNSVEVLGGVAAPIYRVLRSRSRQVKWMLLGDYFATYVDEFALFWNNGTMSFVPPIWWRGPLKDMSLTVDVRQIVAGFQLEYDAAWQFGDARPDIFPPQELVGAAYAQNRAMFRYDQRGLNIALDEVKNRDPQRWAKFYSSNARTKRPENWGGA